MAQLTFIQNILHNNCWAYSSSSGAVKPLVDNGVRSILAWKRWGCVRGGRNFNPHQCFNASCSHWCTAQLCPWALGGVRPSRWALLKALIQRSRCSGRPYPTPVPCLGVGSCSSLAGSGNNPLCVSTEWVVSVWPFRIVTKCPAL